MVVVAIIGLISVPIYNFYFRGWPEGASTPSCLKCKEILVEWQISFIAVWDR